MTKIYLNYVYDHLECVHVVIWYNLEEFVVLFGINDSVLNSGNLSLVSSYMHTEHQRNHKYYVPMNASLTSNCNPTKMWIQNVSKRNGSIKLNK